MEENFASKSVVNNEYDYSNILPTVEKIEYLVKYCDEMNKQLTRLVEDDEEKNKQFKFEYREYLFKKSYGQKFEVYIREKTYNNLTCKDYEQFESAVKGGNLKSVTDMKITLCLDYFRGKGDNIEEYENSFIISFKPYEIKFARKSNHEDQIMDKVEKQINDILKQFSIANTIFCNKGGNDNV